MKCSQVSTGWSWSTRHQPDVIAPSDDPEASSLVEPQVGKTLGEDRGLDRPDASSVDDAEEHEVRTSSQLEGG